MMEKNKNISFIWRKKDKRLEKDTPMPFKKQDFWIKVKGHKARLWIYLIILSVTISFLLFPNILLLSREEYNLDDIAKKDIKASQDFLVEDKELTKQRRDETTRSSLFVYDFDSSKTEINNRIKKAFSYGRKELQSIFSEEVESSLYSKKINHLKNKFFELIGLTEDPVIFDKLAEYGFSQKIENNAIIITNQILEKGVVGDKTTLMSQKGKGIILRDIATQKELKIDNINRFYDLESARQQVSQLLKKNLKDSDQSDNFNSTVQFIKLLITPNITFNKKETEVKKKKASESVNPIFFKVKKGEMIIREGEKITSAHLLKLEAEAKLKRNPPFPSMALSMTIIIGILLLMSYVVLPGKSKVFKESVGNHIFISSTLLVIFLIVLLYSVVAEEIADNYNFLTYQIILFALPVTLGAIVMSVFQGLEVAIAFSLVISVLAAIVAGSSIEFFIYFLAGSFLAAYSVRNCRERMVLIKAGIRVGLLNIIMALSIQILFGNPYSITGAVSIITSFLGGALAGIIATGFLPLIEIIFGFTTDIKLLELSSLEQPILKELMVRAPGTYHHSVVVSNMVEATAEGINANPLLSKVSAYYHDIGKIKKPNYFIENQIKGNNPHEKLAPSLSSLILISHVKDGLELAKQNKLGREIIEITQQHHGTSLIAYFYQKAKDQGANKGDKPSTIIEENFRYPGPKPQTKEAGLILLADSVEAASKTLINPTPARLKGMVQNIINNMFSDGQLDECELTLKDLHYIAKSFTKTLSGIFHSRIEYPEPIVKGEKEKKVENGHTNNDSEAYERNNSWRNKAQIKENLKRLGIT